jgi:hypothetical protein
MAEPAVSPSGTTYERAALERWLRDHRRDPLTGAAARPDQLLPNLGLGAAIEAWLAALPPATA